MKKLLFFLITSLILSGCGGDAPNTNEEIAGKTLYQTPGFAIQAPTDWQILEKQDLTSNISANTIVAFKNNIQNEIFTANLTISAQNTNLNNLDDLTKNSLNAAKNALLNFNVIEENDTNVFKADNKIAAKKIKTSGKTTASSPIIQFHQLYILDNDMAYTLTAANLSTEDESVVKTLEEMLDSFSLK